MPPPDLVLHSRRVVTPDGVGPGSVTVARGKIVAVERGGPAPPPPEDRGAGEPAAGGASRVLDVGEATVMAGLVDAHVHLNDPGRAEWEGFESGTRAAAAGGVTTLVDMPLNSRPPTVDPEGLEAKRSAAEGRCRVDHAFWGGLVPGGVDRLEALLEAGARGVKCFLCPSGIEDFPPVGVEALRRAMRLLAERGAPLLAHAEAPEILAAAARRSARGDRRKHATWLASRPPEAELEAIRLLLGLAAETGCRTHVVHVSTAAALEPLARARAAGLPVTAETCPHYLSFAAEEVPDGATEFKCAPPIRSAANRERLWEGLAEGALDLVASDHSPAPPGMKRREEGDFLAAWGGIASLQLLLPATWTGARRRGLGLERLPEWLCGAPARLAGLEGRKGRLAPGADADLVVWDPEARVRVEPGMLHHRHRQTPWLGRELRGRVLRTFVRGVEVFEAVGEGAGDGDAGGRFPGSPIGRWAGA